GDGRTCQQQLRELRYHPERFLSGDGVTPDRATELSQLIAAKRDSVRLTKTFRNARERHLAIATANEALQPFLEPLREQIRSRCMELQQKQRAESILRSRDYAFCLYPREHFERLLAGI